MAIKLNAGNSPLPHEFDRADEPRVADRFHAGSLWDNSDPQTLSALVGKPL